ncbi:MAG: COG1361 S-layer family protein [Anaerolineaceae bacterium]
MMKNRSKKIISIMLMASLILAAAALALPNAFGNAAPDLITATAPTSSQSGTPGMILHFPVTIVNNNTAQTTINLESGLTSRYGWATSIVGDDSDVLVGAGSSVTVIVDVTIPTTAAYDQNDVATLVVYEGTTFATSVSLSIYVGAPTGASDRPQLNIPSYSIDAKYAKVGTVITLTGVLENRGPLMAYNNNITFEGEGFFPQGNGGVQYIQNISPSGGKWTFTQKFMVGDALDYVETGVIKATVAYLDSKGTAYTDTFSLSIPVTSGVNYYATSTPKTTSKPQLVITKNTTDVDPLQPGSIFELSLNVKNLGTTDAKSVTMVLGGGANSVNDLGTPQPGAGADLTNFAPLGSSNIVVVGDVAQGAEVTINLKLVVNVTTVPGAYTLKTSFVYSDSTAKNFVDDQVITLLVYQLPQVEVSFYRDPGMMTAGMPNVLPLQVTNLGKKSTVLGNMTVTADGVDVTNNTALVGALDPGGYFTLDSEIMPFAEGPLEIKVTITYTDDFNQAREVVQTLNLEVMPEPVFTPDPMMGEDGMPIDQPVTETFWSKVGRFFKGLFGLDSGVIEPAGGDFSTGEKPVEPGGVIISGPKG